MVEIQDVQAAQKRLAGNLHKTPVLTSRTLNEISGANIFLKCENMQRVGAFKFRGAFNAVSLLDDDAKRRGVITHSSGNHAQALALAAKLFGIPAVIVMPSNSPKVKLAATQDTYGAEVVLCEPTLAARESTTNALISERGLALVHPYDNDNIIAGAGTAALELLQEYPELDYVFAPVGGGGLLSGTSTAVKGLSRKTKVFGAEPEIADDARRSLIAGHIIQNENTPKTIADGLRTNLCERTFSIISRRVDGIVAVSEAEIILAMRFLWERMKIVVEPSGAVSLAGALGMKGDLAGKNVGVILSGGNVDLSGVFEGLA